MRAAEAEGEGEGGCGGRSASPVRPGRSCPFDKYLGANWILTIGQAIPGQRRGGRHPGYPAHGYEQHLSQLEEEGARAEHEEEAGEAAEGAQAGPPACMGRGEKWGWNTWTL